MAVSMFGPKGGGLWISGEISPTAAKLFKKKRGEVIALYRAVHGAPPKTVSASNVVEFLLRGAEETRKVFEARRG